MKNFVIDAVVCGSYWEYDVDCPLEWRGSGCYDVLHEFWQMATFKVVAKTLDKALSIIVEHFDGNNGIYYDPSTVKISEAGENDEEGDIESDIDEPVEKEEFPERYSEEA